MAKIVVSLLLLCSAVANINAHVALTFPPARKYDLDFLDNSRTPGPCGMPKGECKEIFFLPCVWDFFKKSLMVVLLLQNYLLVQCLQANNIILY